MITAGSFPTPHLALRDPDQEQDVRAFAERQAQIAEFTRRRLAHDWHRLNRGQRVQRLRQTYTALTEWRYNVAAESPDRLGVGIPKDAERFRTAIQPGHPRIDRVGYLGRLRLGATWDEASRIYVGGAPTPAHDIMLHYGEAAHDRIDAEGVGDSLTNRVVLSDGREVDGTTLVRGPSARVFAAALVRRVESRGRDASRMETGGDGVYLVTADDTARSIMLTDALYHLADDDALNPQDALRHVQAARYLLVEAPQTYKGSDAVIRVLLVAVGSMLLRRPLVLEQDMDLRCLVGGQAAATEMPADTITAYAPTPQ